MNGRQKKGKDELEEEMFQYLDALRESGVTNMYGAAPYLAEMFSLDKPEARRVLSGWMKAW